MFKAHMFQPKTASCDLTATTRSCSIVPEPDLDEVMQDPITIALMVAAAFPLMRVRYNANR